MITEQTISLELAEKSVLGSMLAENYLITEGQVKREHFTSTQHQIIFTAMQELMQANKGVDYITLLSVREPIELGGANYVMELNNYANPLKFNDYADILFRQWQHTKKHQILVQAQQGNWTIQEVQKQLDAISDSEAVQDTSIRSALLAAANRPYEPASLKMGILTDLRDLDGMTNGFQDGELFILAARPSMGKTDTMNHFAIVAGLKGNLPIIFSLEMSKEAIVDRMIAETANINRLNLRDPYTTMPDEQKTKWTKSLGLLDATHIEIDDRSVLTVSQIRATARKLIKQNPARKPLILIDYLQFISPNNPKDNETQQMGQISRELKQMAREFKCPVICLAQLNRSVEQRPNKRPIMSDIRGSGNIEQDADVIAFLYRDEYYNADTDAKNVLEFIIAKHRNGPTGTVAIAYVKETGRLLNLDWGAPK